MTSPKLFPSSITGVSCGLNVSIVEPVNIYGCTLGDDVFIGPFVEIQKDVHIGSRTKIQSHTFICELVTIGCDSFVGHGVMFINDLFTHGGPARGDKSLWRPTFIGNHVAIGSNCTILPVSICDSVTIGAGSVVTHNIEKPGIYVGNPARFLRTIPTQPE